MARKKETFSRYDAVDYLKTEEDIAADLEAVIEDAGDDVSLIAVALGNIARPRGMMHRAKAGGMTREGL